MKIKYLQFKFTTLLLLLLFSGGLVKAQSYERSRTVTESFKVFPETEIQVTNKYGNIHLMPWDKDSVRFEIALSVKANKESKVEKTFEYIDFEFKSTQYYVIAETVFEGKNHFWSDVSDLASTIFSSGTSTQIDYTVYFPKDNKLVVNNKFGNIYTTDHSSQIDITLSNGDLKAHAFKGETRIKLDFGSATIDEIDKGSLYSNYSEVTLHESELLSIESKSSKLYIDYAEELIMNSKRDKYYITSVQSLQGESSFSYVEVEKLVNSLDISTHYGDLKVENMDDAFNYFNLNASYTDISIYFDDAKYYDLEIIRNEKTQITYPANLLLKKETEIDEELGLVKVECKIGEMSIESIPIVIKSKAGKIFLRMP